VLAAIPLFYLSFLKIPIKVWKKIVSIQRNFLWGGSSNKVKVAWVKWSDVCRPKEEGGLGVRDLRLMNISLLTKWRWRLLVSRDLLWKSVLEAKYGAGISSTSDLAQFNNVKHASNWWRDLCCLGRLNANDGGDWCRDIITKKLGSGDGTRFWVDKWVGNNTLSDLFPRLFSVSLQADLKVNQMGEWRDEVWHWNFIWRRHLFVWEGELLVQLLEILRQVSLTHVEDSWGCSIGGEGRFTVKEGYFFLAKNFLPEVGWFDVGSSIVKRVWESLAPSKVVTFSWQLLLQRLPTRGNLFRRGLILPPAQALCVWCSSEVETENHLFMTCPVAVTVWTAVHAWLGLITAVPGNVSLSFQAFGFPLKTKKSAKGFMLIWQTVVWSLWKARNSLIFDGKKVEIYEIVDAIKYRSLDWFRARKYDSICIPYEWEKFPILCLCR
jgi:hypothetical protein